MIVGIGTDIVTVQRIQNAYTRTQGRLATKVLCSNELAVFEHRLSKNYKRGIAFLATRFATKEAFSKAIGIGIRLPMTWHGLQILNTPNGKLMPIYSGALAQFMQDKNWEAQVTVSDEQDIAIAYVIVTYTNFDRRTEYRE